MIISEVALRGARMGWVTSFRASVLGLLAGAFIPFGAAAQPLLPRSSQRSVAGLAVEAPTPRAAPLDFLSDDLVDPYPGTRRANGIHRGSEFRHDIFGWVALGRVLWSSGYDQIAQSPKTWPRTPESYGRRFSTRSAQLVTIEVVRHGFAAALARDPAYVKCACTGFGARLGHVAKGVVTDFDENGTRRIGWPRFAGALAGSAVLGQLQPGQGSAGKVAYRAVTSVAGSFIGNAVKEIGWFGAPRDQERKRVSRDMFE